MKKLSNTEADLKKSVAYKKKRVSVFIMPIFWKNYTLAKHVYELH